MRRTKSLNRESVEKHEAIMRISSMEAVNVGSNLTEVSIMRRTKSLNRGSVEKHEAIMRISSMEAVNVGRNLTEDKEINMKISFKENVFEMLKVQEKSREVIVYLR